MKTISSLLLMAAIFFGSCSNTSVVSTWKAPNASEVDINNVLIVGLMGNQYRPLKEQIENSLVMQLNSKGIKATTSTQEFGPNGFKGIPEDQVVSQINESGYNAVIIISLLDKEKERNYVPGNTYTTSRVVGYSRYYRRYIVVSDRVYSPGYYSNSTNYMLQAEIYAIPQNELLYSVQTKSYNPNSDASLANHFAKSIGKDLTQQQIIK